MPSVSSPGPVSCSMPACPLEAVVAVHGADISTLKEAMATVKASIDRIQWATIAALGSLFLACLGVIFKLLLGK